MERPKLPVGRQPRNDQRWTWCIHCGAPKRLHDSKTRPYKGGPLTCNRCGRSFTNPKRLSERGAGDLPPAGGSPAGTRPTSTNPAPRMDATGGHRPRPKPATPSRPASHTSGAPSDSRPPALGGSGRSAAPAPKPREPKPAPRQSAAAPAGKGSLLRSLFGGGR